MEPAHEYRPAYDALAPRFERDRALPDGVAGAIRDAVLRAANIALPRVLDLGAGTGRIGRPFVEAGDDYVGADLSFGMLQAFAGRCDHAPRLVQADGHRLPFGGATFDAVLLIQVFGGLGGARQFASEVRRVLRPGGIVVIGRTAVPEDGIDAQMKRQLGVILASAGPRENNARHDVERMFRAAAAHSELQVVASWTTERTPRQFISRHRTGARFSRLPDVVKDEAIRALAVWAEKAFGSLDAASLESHSFELNLFEFDGVSSQCPT